VLPYALVAPLVLLLVVFVILPAVLAIGLSLYDWNLLTGERVFAGLDNWRQVLSSQELRSGLVNTVAYVLLVVPPSMILGLLTALAIHALARGAAFWRAVYFLPVASTIVAMSVVWRWMFYPATGLWDVTVGRWTGTRGWLQSLDLALPALAVVGNWKTIGFVTVIFLAGLAGVPGQLHEAARLDGAGPWSRFWHVSWPALGPATLFALLITTITAFRVFDEVRIMTDGGPAGATETLTYLLWRRGIDFRDVGGGAVLTVLLLVLLVLLTAGQLRSFGKRLEESGRR
jgi:multiple sugar transport system permease protein